MLKHKVNNDASFAVVVGGGFAGRCVGQATESNIVLLDVAFLSELLRMHLRMPLNLLQYRGLFLQPGLVSSLPPALKLAFSNREKAANLIVDVVEVFAEVSSQWFNEPLTAAQIFAMLMIRRSRVQYSQPEVDAVLFMLAHPPIEAIGFDPNKGYSLLTNRACLANILRGLSGRLDDSSSETRE